MVACCAPEDIPLRLLLRPRPGLATTFGPDVAPLLTPLLVGLGGARLALITVGALLPVTAACGLRTLRRVDQGRPVPATEVALLRSLPHFADLPGPALETLASALERIDAVPGQVLIRQGGAADRFYAVADGQVAVCVDGQPRGVRGRGTGLGEIALLRRVPRTATVTAPPALAARDRRSPAPPGYAGCARSA